MGVANPLPPPSVTSHHYSKTQFQTNSMSQDYNNPRHHHQGIFSFSNGFDRSQHEQQIRRDKLRLHHQQQQGFDDQPPLVVPIEEIESTGAVSVPGGYETAGMLSEMFNFTSPGATASAGGGGGDMFNTPHPHHHPPAARTAEEEDDTTGWYGNNRQEGGLVVGVGGLQGPLDDNNNSKNLANHHQISGINAAMQLFLMNPQPRSPSPSPSHHPHASSSSTLNMLLPNPSSSSSPALSTLHQGFHQSGHYQSQFTTGTNPSGGIGGQEGLSLSLSSSLQHLEAAKAHEEFRSMGESGILFFNQGGVGSSSSSQYPSYNNKTSHQHQIGFGGASSSSMGMVNVLRNSKYSKAAQELLEDFCSVGRGHHHLKKSKLANNNNNNTNPNSSTGVVGNSSSSTTTSKDLPPLSTADRLEHQRRKVKLLSMLDEARILSLSLSLSTTNHCFFFSFLLINQSTENSCKFLNIILYVYLIKSRQ